MPLQATSGAASYDGFGGGPAAVPNYIEECFATHLYTGNDSTQTITNGIDLSTKGGLVWIKVRDYPDSHRLFDTSRGVGNYIVSNSTSAQLNNSASVTAFNSNGFSLGSFSGTNGTSFGSAYASWTFREQPKFFDVVTYTGNNQVRRISHSLGSTPGCIIVKDYSAGDYNWMVYHRSLGINKSLNLNTTDAEYSNTGIWGTSDPTSTDFGLGSGFINNVSGRTYVAYLFAHDAGGFGLTGTDNVISCGSYVGTSANFVDVNLGYEPQWFMVKRASDTSPWFIIDNMRDMSHSGTSNLQANASNAEQATVPQVIPSATGISLGYSGGGSGYNVNGVTYIYIAIRRGPMKTPTTGTSVYENVAYTGNATANRQIGSSVLMDAMLLNNRDATAQSWSTYGQMFFDRLRGDNVLLATASTSAESTGWQTYFDSDMNAGWDTSTTTSQDYLNKSGATFVSHIFRRAPGFFDVVCYTGTGYQSQNAKTHALGVTPELIIVKSRNISNDWMVYNATLGKDKTIYLNRDFAASTTGGGFWGDGAVTINPTASVFYVGDRSELNSTGNTYVAYLFASCPGVSKVTNFTGTGSLQTINCGFTGGARLVLIKRTDASGDWYIWDSSRGISSSTDPYLLLNSTAAEVTSTNWVDTTSTGFQVTAASGNNVNINGASYIALAIA